MRSWRVRLSERSQSQLIAFHARSERTVLWWIFQLTKPSCVSNEVISYPYKALNLLSVIKNNWVKPNTYTSYFEPRLIYIYIIYIYTPDARQITICMYKCYPCVAQGKYKTIFIKAKGATCLITNTCAILSASLQFTVNWFPEFSKQHSNLSSSFLYLHLFSCVHFLEQSRYSASVNSPGVCVADSWLLFPGPLHPIVCVPTRRTTCDSWRHWLVFNQVNFLSL